MIFRPTTSDGRGSKGRYSTKFSGDAELCAAERGRDRAPLRKASASPLNGSCRWLYNGGTFTKSEANGTEHGQAERFRRRDDVSRPASRGRRDPQSHQPLPHVT